MAKDSFILRSLFGSPTITRDSRLWDIATEETKRIPLSIPSPIQSTPSMHGEMLRFKKSSKELNIPRWCVLTVSSFKYFKSQFSALCDEKPLFFLSTAHVSSVKATANGEEFALELVVGEEDASVSPISTKFSVRSTNSGMTERHLMHVPRYLQPRIGKFTKPSVSAVNLPSPTKGVKKNTTGVRENKNSWTTRENMMYLTEERLIFIVANKGEWEKWQKAFRDIAKIEVVLV
jgi:hypothetical protein